MLTIEKNGRRFYLRNLPFAMKDRAKDAGCKWDPTEKAWWTSKAEVATQISEAPTAASSPTRDAPAENATLAGRVTYRNKAYYLAGKVYRGRTAYEADEVSPIQTQDGMKYLLYFMDGSGSCWAPRAEVQINKQYTRPQTIQGLRNFAAKVKENDGYVPTRGEDYCGYPCPVDGHKCTADHPCHDCQ